jgi:hypothetical protein
LQRLWYVAYGSNLSLERFRCYLRGGQPPGGARHYPGCRDPSEPRADVGVLVGGGIYFAGESTVWKGGMAFYDAELPGQVAARAYLLTPDQFKDVLAQEMRQTPPGSALDLSLVHHFGRHSYGPGHYETLIRIGTRHGAPMVTFTSDRHDRPLAAPSEAYLSTMAVGLREAHGWSAARIGAYLAAVPGATSSWTADEVTALAR